MGGGALQDRRRADDGDPGPRHRRPAARWRSASARAAEREELADMHGRALRRGWTGAGGPTLSRFVSRDLVSGEDVDGADPGRLHAARRARPDEERRRAVAAEIAPLVRGRRPRPALDPAVLAGLRAAPLLARAGLGRDQLVPRRRTARQRPRRPRRVAGEEARCGRSSVRASASTSIRQRARVSAARRSPGRRRPTLSCRGGHADKPGSRSRHRARGAWKGPRSFGRLARDDDDRERPRAPPAPTVGRPRRRLGRRRRGRGTAAAPGAGRLRGRPHLLHPELPRPGPFARGQGFLLRHPDLRRP